MNLFEYCDMVQIYNSMDVHNNNSFDMVDNDYFNLYNNSSFH